MRESITRAAGGQHGQGVDAAAMRLLVSKANDGRFLTRNSTSSTRKWRGDGGGGKRVAVQRTTLYGRASAERVAAADRAAAEKREVGGGGAEAKRAATAEAAAVSASSYSYVSMLQRFGPLMNKGTLFLSLFFSSSSLGKEKY